MSAKLATLDRKLDAAVTALHAKIDLILTRVEALNTAGKPGLTQREFAKLIGVTPRTVTRWLANKQLRLEKGRVPHSEYRKFVS